MTRSAFVWMAVVACEPGPVTPLYDTDIDTDDPIGGGNGSWAICDQIAENGTCTTYTGVSWYDQYGGANLAQQDCVTGDFRTGSFCPVATLGVCLIGAGQYLEQRVSYYLGEWLDESAAEAVENNCRFAEGTWEPAIGSL